MKRSRTRRRFLQITGLTGVSGLAIGKLLRSEKKPLSEAGLVSWEWRGILFGADASISLHGLRDTVAARRLTERCFEEMRRLERIFSIYDPGSAVSRLNRVGSVDDSTGEFVQLIEKSLEVSARTDGAFDITVQPLWRALNEHDFSTGSPVPEIIAPALARVGWRHVRIVGQKVSFERPGMAITLNGIAQGFITDRVTQLLRADGITQALVNMGEFRALGHHPEGREWELGIRAPGFEDAVIDSVALQSGAALAVSGGYGYAFDAEGRHHHLLHPVTGQNMPVHRSIAVTAPNATLADAVSTACAVLDDDTALSVSRRLACQLRIYNAKSGA